MVKENKSVIVTIDGPASSGKSTTARRVAERLDFLYLDSGALYRVVTLAALRRQADFSDPGQLAAIAADCEIELQPAKEGLHVFLYDEDVSDAIRMPEVSRAIGPVAANPGVRQALLSHQRKMAEKGSIVAEGRDMGTVVFPQADIKIFLIASLAERARRRQKELAEKGITVDHDELERAISKRDNDDSSRSVSPLLKPEGAFVLDTTRLTIDQQVEWIIRAVLERSASK